MRLVFAGTPEFAVPTLRAAMAQGDVIAVYTQPDRPTGRGRKLTPSPVKQMALDAGIPVYQPHTLRDAEAQAGLRALRPDLMIVVAYGLILPQAVLEIPRFGCWNLHASLLPRWRGAAPIQRAIEAGDTQTGVCLMQMEQGLDTGPVLLTRTVEIAPEDTSGHLHDRLTALGAEILIDGLTRLRNGNLPRAHAQPADGISYAHKLDKSEARLDWTQPADILARKVRAFHPWPIAEAEVSGERLRIHAAQALDSTANAPPGTLAAASPDGLDIACGQGILRLLHLQRDGGKPISAADWWNARALGGRRIRHSRNGGSILSINTVPAVPGTGPGTTSPPSIHTMKCYLINLDRSPERLAAMHAHLSALGIAYERVPGVDGASLDEATFGHLTRENRYYKPLRRGEVGCYLSHNKALQCFLDSAARHALILEDDAVLDPDICTLITQALTLRDSSQDPLSQWDVLKLNRSRRRRIELAPLGSRFLVEYGLSVPSTTTAALWTRAGAERWLAAFRGCPRPIDCDLQYPWETGLTILSVHPPVARPDNVHTTLGSPLSHPRSPWPKLRYEINRIWPRLRYFSRRYGWPLLLRWMWQKHLTAPAARTT